MNTKRSSFFSAILLFIGFLLCSVIAFAEIARDTKKYEGYREDTRESLTDARSQLAATMALYNSLLKAEAEDAESVYRDLGRAIKKNEKIWKGYVKDAGRLSKQAGKMFDNWNEEIAEFSDAQIRELGQQRLDVARTVFDFLADKMNTLNEVYQPFMVSISEQVIFMSRDLSPEAMAVLQPVAQELNASADKLLAGMDAFLAGPPPEEAVAAIIEEVEAGETAEDEVEVTEAVESLEP